MDRFYRVMIMIVFALGITLGITAITLTVIDDVGADPIKSEKGPKCNKACQRSNDYFVPIKDFEDFFVNDSDGNKDSVFTIYHNIPMRSLGEGVKCDVITKFEAEGVAMTVVCPNGKTYNSSGSVTQEDDE